MTTMAWDVHPRFVSVPAARVREASTSGDRAGRTVGHPGSTGLRLTRRGRLVVMLSAGVVTLLGVLSAQSATAESPASAVPVITHTVAAGETLWEVAGSISRPGEDRRDVVADLIVLNGLTGAGVQSGQQILVPLPGQG